MMLALVHRHAVWTFSRCRCLLLLPQKHITSSIHTSCCISGGTVPELTSIRYPNVVRGDFGSVTAADVDFFKKFLNSPGQVLTDADELISYNIDWLNSYRGNTGTFIVHLIL